MLRDRCGAVICALVIVIMQLVVGIAHGDRPDKYFYKIFVHNCLSPSTGSLLVTCRCLTLECCMC